MSRPEHKAFCKMQMYGSGTAIWYRCQQLESIQSYTFGARIHTSYTSCKEPRESGGDVDVGFCWFPLIDLVGFITHTPFRWQKTDDTSIVWRRGGVCLYLFRLCMQKAKKY